MGIWAWHVHHDTLVEEWDDGPLSNRAAYIHGNKPRREVPTRLRLLQPVRDVHAVRAAQETYDAAVRAAWETYNEVMTDPRKTYDAAVRAAWKTYDAAVADPRETYNEAMTDPRKTYDAAVAAPWKTYAAAVAAAWETYEAAVAAAQETYDEALADLHCKECPGCPWDGTSIFPGVHP